MKRKNEINARLVLAGVGGQGVLFATKVFSETALALGYEILGSETHGMSQRGGSVISHLKVGACESPLVRQGTADVLFAFDRQEAYRTLSFVKRGGLCVVNNPRGDSWGDGGIRGYLEKNQIAAHTYAADEVALEVGSPRSVNLALIGYALSIPEMPFDYQVIRGTVERISPPRFTAANLKALDAGYRRE